MNEAAGCAGGGGFTVSVNVSAAPAYDAVNVTGVGLETVAALAANVALELPCAMVTLAGMPTLSGEAVTAMAAPPLSAGADSAMVHVDDAGGAIVTGLHVKPFKPGCRICTLAPAADTASGPPLPSAADGLVN